MKLKKVLLALICFSSPLYAEQDQQLQQQIQLLQNQTQALQSQLTQLQNKLTAQKNVSMKKGRNTPAQEETVNAAKKKFRCVYSSSSTYKV